MTTNTIFTSKEHYLAFRAAWKKAANSKTLSAKHFVLLNFLTGKHFYRGFTPITNKNKLANGGYLNYSLYEAIRDLQVNIRMAKEAIDAREQLATNDPSLDELVGRYTPTTKRERLTQVASTIPSIIAPFEGTISLEMLAKLEVQSIDLIAPYSPAGKTFLEAIKNGAAPTMETLYATSEMKEVA